MKMHQHTYASKAKRLLLVPRITVSASKATTAAAIAKMQTPHYFSAYWLRRLYILCHVFPPKILDRVLLNRDYIDYLFIIEWLHMVKNRISHTAIEFQAY